MEEINEYMRECTLRVAGLLSIRNRFLAVNGDKKLARQWVLLALYLSHIQGRPLDEVVSYLFDQINAGQIDIGLDHTERIL